MEQLSKILSSISKVKAELLEKINNAIYEITKAGDGLLEEILSIEMKIKTSFESGNQSTNFLESLEYYSQIRTSGSSLAAFTDQLKGHLKIETGNPQYQIFTESTSSKELCKLLPKLLQVELDTNYQNSSSRDNFFNERTHTLMSLLGIHIASLPYEETEFSLKTIFEDKALGPTLRFKISDLRLELRYKDILKTKNSAPSEIQSSLKGASLHCLEKTVQAANTLGIRTWHEVGMDKCKALIVGPMDSPFEGGFYFLDIEIKEGYPFKPPNFRFATLIFHPNITIDGKFDIDILKDNWSPALYIEKSIISIQSILGEINADENCALNEEAYLLFVSLPDEYAKIAEQWKVAYAL